MKKKSNKLNEIVLYLVILITLIAGYYYLEPKLTGLTVTNEEQVYTDNLNLVINENQEYEWQLSYTNFTRLNSIKVSGSITGTGSVQIFIENEGKRYLILDSNNLAKESPSVTGYSIEESSQEQPTETTTEATSEQPQENQVEEIESQQETPTVEEQITQESPAKEGQPIQNETLENLTEEQEPIESKNITEEVHKEITELEENITTEEKIKTISFTDICTETCSLTNFINKSYKLIFEMNNTKINLDKISYTIKLIILDNITTQNITQTNLTGIIEEDIQHEAIIGKPVKWTKKVKLENPTNDLIVKLPKDVSDVKVNKIDNKSIEEITDKTKIKKPDQPSFVTGSAIREVKNNNRFIDFLDWFKGITSYAVKEIEDNETELIIDEEVQEIEIEYYTEAPQVLEKEFNAYRKQITVYSEVHYKNILTFTQITESLKESVDLYWLVNETRQLVENVTYKDTNNNGLIDTLEWITPYLSNQTYEVVIKIIKAQHLDENYNFISDIYNETIELDNIWSEPIYNNEYIRVTFEKRLSSSNDITLYTRNNQSLNTTVEVYYYNSSEKITEFLIITEEEYYKVYLVGMNGTQDTFDLKIKNIENNESAFLEFDHIIDPDCTNPTITINLISSSVNIGSTTEVQCIVDVGGGECLPATLSWQENQTVTFKQVTQWSNNFLNCNNAVCSGSTAGGETLSQYVRCNAPGKYGLRCKWGTYVSTASLLTCNTESTAPISTLVSPSNFSTQKSPATFRCNSTDNGWLSNVTLYGNWTGTFVANQTIAITNQTTGIANTTTFSKTLSSGQYLWNCLILDTSNNQDWFDYNWTVTVDATPPLINISSPLNSTYGNVSIDLNVSANEAITSWKYSMNNGKNNYTFTPNITLSVGNWSAGNNNITVYANDSVNNLNFSIVFFFIDTTPPLINISSPQNITYSINSIDLNVSASETISTWKYSMNNGINNYTFTPNITLSAGNFTEGSNTITVYANDSYNNLNSSSINFNLDIVQVNLTTPTDLQSLTTTNINFSCNVTINSASYNITNVSLYTNTSGLWAINQSILINISKNYNNESQSSVDVDSTFSSSYNKVFTTDNKKIQCTNGAGCTWASTRTAGVSHWINVTFTDPKELGKIRIMWTFYASRYYTPQNFTIQAWNSSSNSWITIINITGKSQEENTTLYFEPITTNMLKFEQCPSCGVAADPNIAWIAEFEAFPSPNKTIANFTVQNINYGNYIWNCNGCSDTNNCDFASTNWTFSITSPNTAPNNPSPITNSTDGSNQTAQDLNCFFTPSDPDTGEVLYTNVTWLKNNVTNLTFTSISVTNGTFYSSLLKNQNTTKNDSWNCQVQVCDDSSACSSWVNSSQLLILNTPPPTPTLSSPSDGSSVTNRTPTFTWGSVADDDGDPVIYDIFIGCNTGCSGDNRSIYNISSTSYTPSTDFAYLYDNNYFYSWKVRAYDNSSYSSNTSSWIVNITARISIILLNNTVNFTTLNPGDYDDTLDNNPNPFTIRNNGTAITTINITLLDSGIWSRKPSPTNYFGYKIANFTGEEGAFDWALSTTSWTRVPVSNESSIRNLLYQNSSNSKITARVELNLTVPSDEPAGVKGTGLSFVGWLAE